VDSVSPHLTPLQETNYLSDKMQFSPTGNDGGGGKLCINLYILGGYIITFWEFLGY
jgi:hypothetical protein